MTDPEVIYVSCYCGDVGYPTKRSCGDAGCKPPVEPMTDSEIVAGLLANRHHYSREVMEHLAKCSECYKGCGCCAEPCRDRKVLDFDYCPDCYEKSCPGNVAGGTCPDTF